MNILWLSWRDIKNPQSGGAEKVAIEVAKRIVRDGSNVTIFTSRFENSKPKEIIDGVNIKRKGNQLTCRLFAFLYYLKNPNFDIVIDEINTIPFFTNFYAKSKSIVLIHQLAKEYWFKQTIFPLNIIGYFIEPFWLKLYRNFPTLALSNSTKVDLIKLGFRNVSIYRIGLDIKPQLITKKENLILFIGRLIPAKGPKDAIKAFSIIHKSIPDLKLSVIGKGHPKFIGSLRELIIKLNLEKSVKLEGFVNQSKKLDLLKKAKIILIPSVREGWSLVVPEANALGVIPIGYNVPGLKDSIQNGKTGLLSKPNPQNLADTAIKLLSNTKLQKTLSSNGVLWAKQFNFEKTYQSFKKIIVDN